jgi:hypothetical protein
VKCLTVPLLLLVAMSCRLFGTKLAEMPYVATRKDARRAGNCRRLLKVRGVAAAMSMCESSMQPNHTAQLHASNPCTATHTPCSVCCLPSCWLHTMWHKMLHSGDCNTVAVGDHNLDLPRRSCRLLTICCNGCVRLSWCCLLWRNSCAWCTALSCPVLPIRHLCVYFHLLVPAGC